VRKITKIIISIMLVSGLLVGCGAPDEGDGRRGDVSFATSGQGGTFYVAGAGISSLVTTEVEGLTVTAEVTKGVVENVRLMASGETEMGFAYGSTAYNISRGLAEFDGQTYEGLRAVANIHDGALNFVTLEKYDILSLDDLIGKKVSIGPKGSGSASVATEFLMSAGLFDQIDVRYLSFDDSASSLRDGHIDALAMGGTSPIPALIELEASHPMRVLPVDQARVDKFLVDYPYHVEYTIPVGVYTSVTEPLLTVGYSVIWVANESVPEWIVYEMLTEMFADEGREYLELVQRAFKEMSPGIKRFEKINLPLHPGAAKYYEENGIVE
jgi:TRAP transporter TAXI family solute receptor